MKQLTLTHCSIRDHLIGANVQLGGTYNVGKLAVDKYSQGYEAAAKYINAGRDEIVLGSSTTQLFRNLSQIIQFEKGDEIVVSAVDHEANIASWVDLAHRDELVIKWWKPEPTPNPRLTPENLKPLLSDKTRLVTCTHASNILGTIHDIKVLAATVHEFPKALIAVDGVAYAPHRALDVKDLDVDFYAFSWYKVFGPHISILYAHRRTLEQLGSLGHFFNAHSTLEGKLGLAGSNYELVASLPAVVEYLGTAGDERWAARSAHENALEEALLGYLTGREDVTIYGEPTADPALRLSTVSFGVAGWKPKDLVEAIEAESNFGLKWGHFYSWRLIEQVLRLDPREGVARVSTAHYNSIDEIKGFIGVLDRVLSGKK